MNEYILHLNERPFRLISSGLKKIEMRLNDEKRSKLRIGDVLIFINRTNENERIKTKIVGLYKFKDFQELYKHFSKLDLGYLDDEVCDYKDMEQYYSPEEQSKYGVLAIEIRLL